MHNIDRIIIYHGTYLIIHRKMMHGYLIWKPFAIHCFDSWFLIKLYPLIVWETSFDKTIGFWCDHFLIFNLSTKQAKNIIDYIDN